MISPMPIETLPSWKALNKDFPRSETSQDLKYVIVAGATILAVLLATYVIVNYQQENSKEQLPEENA
jgi:hypothetical protein